MATETRTQVPLDLKLYHIVHMDRLSSIVKAENLFCDAEMQKKNLSGTTIGMKSIKDRRLQKALTAFPSLHVGDCVPFYFCPRSVMLYLFYKNNHENVAYHGGQEAILHLVFDLKRLVDWAGANQLRWVFTDSNAGSYYFNDYNNLDQLNHVNWSAVQATDWQNCREQKQAEFLVETRVPCDLIEMIGVYSTNQLQNVTEIMAQTSINPSIQVMRNWYY